MFLQQVELPIVPFSLCQQAYNGINQNYHLCAGYEEGGRDICEGMK